MPGTNTNVIAALLEQKIDKYRPDLVITMMGVNDNGGHLPYTVDSMSGVERFWDSFRAYKLLRLVGMHITARIKGVPLPLRRDNGLVKKGHPAGAWDEAHAQDEQMSFLKREKECRDAIALNPGDDQAYVRLGVVLKEREALAASEKAFQRAIEINPQGDVAYAELGWLYGAHSRMPEAIAAFKRSTEINSGNTRVWDALAAAYQSTHQYALAEAAYQKELEIVPQEDESFGNMGMFYLRQGAAIKAEAIFEKAIEIHPDDDRAYARLALLYCEMGKDDLCREYTRKTKEMSGDVYGPMTRNNYQKVKQVLLQKKVGWICVQYPTLSVASLQEVVGSGEGIVFVDNERLFKVAVQREGYTQYFIDTMGGTWGHCTDAGNKLLAKNIANVIKEKLGVQ
ncbi:MAG: tetratricopeptide repeat protein [Candidatus Omnitrophota bacterium]